MTGLAAVHLQAGEVCDFLVAQGLSALPGSGNRDLPLAVGLAVGDELPAKPDRLYAITPTGGPGLQVERAVDVQSFQVRSRGRSAVGSQLSVSAQDAESLAWTVDGLLMSLTAGLIGARWVSTVDRVGSPPTFLMRDRANRVHLTCNYLFHVARSD